MWLVGRGGGGGGGGEGGEEGGRESASPCACGTNGCTRGNIFHISCQSKDTAVRGQKVNQTFKRSKRLTEFKGQQTSCQAHTKAVLQSQCGKLDTSIRIWLMKLYICK